MNCRSCGHPMWRHKSESGCDTGVRPNGAIERCGCPKWKGAEVTSSDIDPASSDIPDGVALLDGRTWSVIAAGELPDGDRMARLTPVRNELAEWGIGASDPAPDGWRFERYGRRWISNRLTGELYETDPDDDSDDGDPLYRLVPVSTPVDPGEG